MIDKFKAVFQVKRDEDTGRGVFVNSLSAVIDAHMSTSKKYFTPATLAEDFKSVGAVVTPQAINSALVTLARKKRVFKEQRGLYRHANTLVNPR